GPMAVGDAEQEVFLGRELTQRREISERTSENVDDEIKRILDEAFIRARQTLENNRVLLEKISEALLERETLDREDVDLLAAGMPLPEFKPRPALGEVANGNNGSGTLVGAGTGSPDTAP
ncbi:MAG TPA: hypothetical protein VFZ04_04490, partial [Longimicrobiales bacterium]